MRKTKKILLPIVVSMLLVSNSSVVAEASNEYAYSIGVNHGLIGTLTGDFTDNVDYASTCYGMISEITNSYKNYTPTRDYMFGNNPNGDRRIASKIVFLNGHGNYDHIAFNAGNDGGNYATGVIDGYDDTEVHTSGYLYVGLKSTDMSTCDHISFVACKTGLTTSQGGSCVSRRAFWEGANSSLGFKDEITSRFFSGPDWLEVYNDHLANGYTIAQSVAAATAAYPNSDLGDYAIVWGDSYNTVTSSTSRSSSEGWYDVIETSSRDEGSIKSTANIVASPFKEHIDEYTSLIDAIQKEDPDFVADNYKITVNMFGEDSDVGLAKVVYYIGDDIQTNKAYVALIEKGRVSTVYKTNIGENENIVMSDDTNNSDEEDLISLVKQYSENKALETIAEAEYRTTNDPILSQRQRFFYDYRTEELVAVDSVFYLASELDNAIVDHTIETVLN